jgi:UDP-N-acetylmuramyl pentapeptide phosphotransferase/UDP-N-acetylglucosamine-1-phosphate transferase
MAQQWGWLYGWAATALFAGILSFVASSVATAMARNAGMIIEPGERQSHNAATPTGGGLGLVLAIVATSFYLHASLPLPAFWWKGMLPGILLLGAIGWLDDSRQVSAWLRLLVQLAVSLCLIACVPLQSYGGGMVTAIITVVAMVWYMNLYNFMDGSNGMAAFQGVFAGLLLAVLFGIDGQAPAALLALVTAAACAGFLPLNFPSARVFMGDVASVPLGFIFAALSLYGVGQGVFAWPVAVLVMAVFVVDATLTLLARVIRRERWYTAHAQHVYQRLIGHGWSHCRVLVVYQAINVVIVLPAVVLAEKNPNNAALTACLTFVLLGACWYFANRRLGMLAEVQI